MTTRGTSVTFEFVDSIPPTLPVEATLYIAFSRRVTAHLCLCGCGEKVVLPLRPNRWSLTYDGETISMAPSIGNSGLACRSHYWIKKSRVEWWSPLSDEQISFGMARDGWIGSSAPTGHRLDDHEPEATRRPWWRRLLPWPWHRG